MPLTVNDGMTLNELLSKADGGETNIADFDVDFMHWTDKMANTLSGVDDSVAQQSDLEMALNAEPIIDGIGGDDLESFLETVHGFSEQSMQGGIDDGKFLFSDASSCTSEGIVHDPPKRKRRSKRANDEPQFPVELLASSLQAFNAHLRKLPEDKQILAKNARRKYQSSASIARNKEKRYSNAVRFPSIEEAMALEIANAQFEELRKLPSFNEFINRLQTSLAKRVEHVLLRPSLISEPAIPPTMTATTSDSI